mgnify:FL=1
MEQVKIFTRGFDDLCQELEDEVNDWLKSHPKISVISRQATLACGTNLAQQVFVNCTIVIFYKE